MQDDDDRTEDDDAAPGPRDAGSDDVAPPEEVGGDDVVASDEDGGAVGQSTGTRSWAELLGSFAAGVAAALVLVVLWGAVSGDDEPGGPTTGADLAGAGSLGDSALADSALADDALGDDGAPSSAEQPMDSRLDRCLRAARALQAPLEAARPTLDQWGVHVGAMNQLVVGELTLQQATAFWNRTRVGARRMVGDFRDTMRVLRRQGVDCPRPDLVGSRTAALACARQVEARLRVLQAAGTSIDMWEGHIHHMDMLRLGQMSPEDATRMWLSMWQRGVRELDAYRLVSRRAADAGGCSG